MDNRGWTERQVIALTVVLGTAFGITALFLNTFEKFIAIILLFVVMLWLTRHALSAHGPSATPPH